MTQQPHQDFVYWINWVQENVNWQTTFAELDAMLADQTIEIGSVPAGGSGAITRAYLLEHAKVLSFEQDSEGFLVSFSCCDRPKDWQLDEQQILQNGRPCGDSELYLIL